MTRTAFSIACLVLSTLAAAAQVERRTFQDWEAAVRSDELGWVTTRSTRTPKGQERPGRLELLRGSGGQAPWHVVLVTTPPLDREKPLTLRLDGQARPVPAGQLVARDDASALTLQHIETLNAIGGALKNAKTLGIEGTDTTGKPITLEFSLAGLAAAMLWLDEKQHRVGKPAAFAPIEAPERGPFMTATGDRPPETTEPRVTVALPPRQRWPEGVRDLPPAILERHVIAGDCDEPDFSAADARGRFWSARLDPWTTLYGVGCTSGAYNQLDRLYLVNAGNFRQIQPLTFAEPDGADGWETTDLLTNVDVNEVSGTLTAFNKGRGLGDCGSIGTWRWTGGKFSLREYRAEGECNGRTPDKWPVLFRAKPR